MTAIKICGLRRPEDIEAVNEVKPDYCGFIIEFPKSFRSISCQKVRELTVGLDKAICPVGVFVNAPVSMIAELLQENVIAMAQLHGQETEEDIRTLQRMTGKPVIKAFSVKTAEDVKMASQSCADYVLLDQGSGGTGKTFDWSLIRDIGRDYFLAGGLGSDNLEEAIHRFHPFAVDLSSSLETDRVKDTEKMRHAVRIVRETASENQRGEHKNV